MISKVQPTLFAGQVTNERLVDGLRQLLAQKPDVLSTVLSSLPPSLLREVNRAADGPTVPASEAVQARLHALTRDLPAAQWASAINADPMLRARFEPSTLAVIGDIAERYVKTLTMTEVADIAMASMETARAVAEQRSIRATAFHYLPYLEVVIDHLSQGQLRELVEALEKLANPNEASIAETIAHAVFQASLGPQVAS